ncbi:MAG: hypothetical protein JSR85_04210 [Proteobacteria bacterium]|nr:hypothetical protein [Pseudomonadota bacterium]
MSDFLRELEEDIREERIFILWRKYGNYIIGLALAIVLATVSYTLWQYFKHKSQVKSHVSFSNAVTLMKLGKKEEALKAFEILSQESGGYGKLSLLYEGALLSNPEDAYKRLSRLALANPALGNLPKVLRAARELDNPIALESLESLTSPNNAWAPLSLELLALASLKKGDTVEAAGKYIRILKEPYSTPTEELRASLMLSQIDAPAYLFEQE